MMKMIVPARRADSLEDRTPPTNIIAACSVETNRRYKEGRGDEALCARVAAQEVGSSRSSSSSGKKKDEESGACVW